MVEAEVVEDALAHSLLESYKLFVKTTTDIHAGGFVFFSLEEFDNAKGALEKEVIHLFESEKAKDASVEFVSWGAVSSLTGGFVEEITTYPGD